MRFLRKKSGQICPFGFTLIEVLVSVAVIAILITITLGIASRVENAIKEKKTQAAIALLTTALEKYYAFWNGFPLIDKTVANDFVGVDFEWDNTTDNQSLKNRLNITSAEPSRHIAEYASIEGVYFLLNKTPVARDILGKIDSSLVTAKDDNGVDMILTVDSRDYPLFRVNDAWKTPLRYTYDKDADSFPLIESAGADKVFGDGTSVGDKKDESYSADNITNR